jgi:hypothetical protein
MNPDTPDDVEIGYSSSRMLPLVALAATMTLLGASIAFDWFGYSGIGRCHTLAGYAGLAFFGVATCRLVWRLSAAKGPVLLIGRYGIRDLRVANEFILWDSIAGVSACEYRRRKFVALKITPALRAGGLTADFDRLFDACTAYGTAAKQAGAAREQKSTAPSQWIAWVA